MTATERARLTTDRCTHIAFDGVACWDCIVAALLAHEAEVREECAKIAEREGCNDRGCWTTYKHNEHSLQCPIGIGRAIRDAGREKEPT